MTHDPSSSLITGPPRHRLRGGCAATYLHRGRVRAARYGRTTSGSLQAPLLRSEIPDL